MTSYIAFVFAIDINECASGNGGCAQTCTNNVGSYQCSCGTGYNLNSDNHGCDGMSSIQGLLIIIAIASCIIYPDINECTLGTNNCNHICHNTIGSYYCSCNAGYHLLNHPHICVGT